MTEDRNIVDHITRVAKEPIEDILERNLGSKYGTKFGDYRRDYHRTLNADKDGFVPDFPLTVTIELVNRCNLTCVMCYTENHQLPKATLSIEEVERIMKETADHDGPAVLMGMGSEAMVYKQVSEVIAAAEKHDIMDRFFITNGTRLPEEFCEQLVKSGVSRVMISIDAVKPETYKKIRGKDELATVEANVERLLEVRARHGSELPIVRLSFCVQKLNVDEKEEFRTKWQDKVDFLDFQIMQDFSDVDELLDTGNVAELAGRTLDAEAGDLTFCHHPFGYLNVWSNGDISPCCTFYGKNLTYGNIKTHSLKEVWDGEKMADLRQQFKTGDLNPTCRACLIKRDNETFEKAFPDDIE